MFFKPASLVRPRFAARETGWSISRIMNFFLIFWASVFVMCFFLCILFFFEKACCRWATHKAGGSPSAFVFFFSFFCLSVDVCTSHLGHLAVLVCCARRLTRDGSRACTRVNCCWLALKGTAVAVFLDKSLPLVGVRAGFGGVGHGG